LLFGTAALAALGFGALSLAVARGKTSRFDRRAQRKLHTAGLVRVAARGSTPIGKWWGQIPASLATALRLWRAERPAGALAVAGTSLGAALLPPLLDRAFAKRLPPPERHEPNAQSFPSGHALQTSAVAVTTGYVLWREGMARPWVAVGPLGLASFAAGAGRLLLDRHWTTDVVAGYCAGIAFGAACAGAYELWRPPSLV
jgi:membrane-associated phospholipid phosphatase